MTQQAARAPRQRSLVTAFLSHARETPDAVAFTVGGRPTSYGEAALGAQRLATAITEGLGRRPGRVGILAAKSATAYEGVLASLLAGAAYVPLHPAFPAARTREMAQQARLDAIIADAAGARRLAEVVPSLSPSPEMILLPDEESAPLPDEASAPLVLTRRDLVGVRPLASLAVAAPDDLAYLMFTSGSTGTPKGVPITHAAALAAVDATLARVPLTSADRISQGIDPTFDLSVAEMFMAWEVGARCCAIAPNELLAPARAVARDGLTAWVCTPSLVAHLRRRDLLAPESLPSLRWTLFCGEPLPQVSALAWSIAAPGSVIENLYGPTEATIWCFARRFDALEPAASLVNGIVPIGLPLQGTTHAIIDDQLRIVTGASEGELCLAGSQLSPGYWDAPEATERAFFTAAGEDDVVRRWYRTGDRVRRLPSGELAHLGRLDSQVKVLGHRVELGEIEQALRAAAPGLTEAAAVAWPTRDGSATGIVAFVVGRHESQAIVDVLRRVLPAWAVPTRLIALDELPRNTSGKVDRVALQGRLDSEDGP